MVKHYAAQGVNEDVALRVYTSRLLGREPALVQHGGGNTSVKTVAKDATGEEVAVICVKGSGWDLERIEPPGLPAVRLEPLRRLDSLQALRDEDMVNLQRANNVIFLDRSWNPAQNVQARDRVYRNGQTRPVNVVDIVARDTVDELRVTPAIANKEALRRMILGGR